MLVNNIHLYMKSHKIHDMFQCMCIYNSLHMCVYMYRCMYLYKYHRKYLHIHNDNLSDALL